MKIVPMLRPAEVREAARTPPSGDPAAWDFLVLPNDVTEVYDLLGYLRRSTRGKWQSSHKEMLTRNGSIFWLSFRRKEDAAMFKLRYAEHFERNATGDYMLGQIEQKMH